MHNVEKVGDVHFEAVSVTELKKHCFVYHTADDAYIGTLSIAAREMVEKDLNISLVGQTYAWHTESSFPSVLCLPINPVLSIEGITYTDADGVEQTLDDSLYTLKAYKNPAEIHFTDTPTATDVVISFNAGFESVDDVNNIPQLYKQAVMFLVKHWYDMREPVTTGSVASVPLGYERIISRCRVWSFK